MSNVYLFIHILFGAIWIGGGVVSMFLLTTVKNLSPDRSEPIIDTLLKLGKFVFAPASLLVLLSGLALIVRGIWEFSDLWISLAFTGFIASTIIGAVFHPRAGKSAYAAAQKNDGLALTRAISQWLVIAALDFFIIASILAMMIFKPGA